LLIEIAGSRTASWWLAAAAFIAAGDALFLREPMPDGDSKQNPTWSIVALALIVMDSMHVGLRSDASPDGTRSAWVAGVGSMLAGALIAVGMARDLRRGRPTRGNASLCLSAIALLLWWAHDVDVVETFVFSPYGELDEKMVGELLRFRVTLAVACAELVLVLAIAIVVLVGTRGERQRGVSLLCVSGTACSMLIAPVTRVAREAYIPTFEPLQTALDLGIVPPIAHGEHPEWTKTRWSFSPKSPVLLIAGGGPPEYFTRTRAPEDQLGALVRVPESSASLATVGLNVDEDSVASHDDLTVLIDGKSPFRDLTRGLSYLGERRSDLWLAVVPPGWKEPGVLRRLVLRGDSIALGVESRLRFNGAPEDPSRGRADPHLRSMRAAGSMLGLSRSDGTDRCVKLECNDATGYLTFSKRGPCPPYPLADESSARDLRISALRATGARKLLFAPEPDMRMDEVVREIGVLSADLDQVRNDDWKQWCPPGASCDVLGIPSHTGEPEVWLTANDGRLKP
jgi:hypothetical protein